MDWSAKSINCFLASSTTSSSFASRRNWFWITLFKKSSIFNDRKSIDQKNLLKSSSEIFSKKIHLDKNELAAKALSLMAQEQITSLCVYNKKNKLKTIGVLHIHNILQSNIS